MSGVDFKISVTEARRAHAEHLAGWSLRAIARRHHQHWGYASPGSALEGLRGALRTLGLPVRGRIEQTVRESLVHGNSRRAARIPGHPDHARHLAHRRALRAAKRRRTP